MRRSSRSRPSRASSSRSRIATARPAVLVAPTLHPLRARLAAGRPVTLVPSERLPRRAVPVTESSSGHSGLLWATLLLALGGAALALRRRGGSSSGSLYGRDSSSGAPLGESLTVSPASVADPAAEQFVSYPAEPASDVPSGESLDRP